MLLGHFLSFLPCWTKVLPNTLHCASPVKSGEEGVVWNLSDRLITPGVGGAAASTVLPAAAASAGELRNRFIKGYNVTRVSTEPLAMMMMMLGCWACQTEQDKRRKRRRGQEGIENAQRHGKHSRKLLDTFIFPFFLHFILLLLLLLASLLLFLAFFWLGK